MKPPTIEEGRALWHAIEREDNPKVMEHARINGIATTALAMFGGVCAGEMAGLQWEFVDFVEGYIWINHSLSRYGGLKEPKSFARYRQVAMSAEMNKWLTEVAKRDGFPRTGYVFRGDPRYRRAGADEQHLLRSMTSRLQAAQVRHGFVDKEGKALWTMHQLRHYAGSVWLELGYRLEDVSRMLGHGKIATTQKYYIYFFKKQHHERDRLMMAKVSELHRLQPGELPALPKPRRDSCDIDGEAIDIE